MESIQKSGTIPEWLTSYILKHANHKKLILAKIEKDKWNVARKYQNMDNNQCRPIH